MRADRATQASTAGYRKCKVLRSIRKPESNAPVQQLHSVAGSSRSASGCISCDRAAEAGEKTPRLPLGALLESHQRARTPCADRIAHGRRIAFGARSRHNAQSRPSIDKWSFAADEFEKRSEERRVGKNVELVGRLVGGKILRMQRIEDAQD